MGGLRAGKEAHAKVRSAWHAGLDPTVSVKDMIKKEAAASEKAETDWNKAHARLNKPAAPFKPHKQQQQQQQHQQKPKGGRKRKRPRGRGWGSGGGQRQKQQPSVQLKRKSSASQNPKKGNTAAPYVKQPLVQKICYA